MRGPPWLKLGEMNSPLTSGFLPKCMGFETASSHPHGMLLFKLLSFCFRYSFGCFPNPQCIQVLALGNGPASECGRDPGRPLVCSEQAPVGLAWLTLQGSVHRGPRFISRTMGERHCPHLAFRIQSFPMMHSASCAPCHYSYGATMPPLQPCWS